MEGISGVLDGSRDGWDGILAVKNDAEFDSSEYGKEEETTED